MKIKRLDIEASFRYFWLKYIEDFDLSNHCARAFIGKYEKNLSIGLILPESEYYYMCGVSSPYIYNNNFHLAFRHKEGSEIKVKRHGVKVWITDAEEIEITPLMEGEAHHPKGKYKEFYTCRNWQFAYQISKGKEN